MYCRNVWTCPSPEICRKATDHDTPGVVARCTLANPITCSCGMLPVELQLAEGRSVGRGRPHALHIQMVLLLLLGIGPGRKTARGAAAAAVARPRAPQLPLTTLLCQRSQACILSRTMPHWRSTAGHAVNVMQECAS